MARVVRKKGKGAENLRFLLDGLDTNKVGKVGWFETAKYEDGTPIAYVAAIQEFGSPKNKILPRPFMRPTIAERRASWRALAQSGAKAILQGRFTMDEVLEGIGMQAAGDIAKTISKIWAPSLKPATVKARARRKASGKITKSLSKPLVDSGMMISTITNSVEEP